MVGTASQYAAIAIIVAVCAVVIARFELLCFRDLGQRADAELNYLSRTGWALVIAIVIPLGGIAYLSYGAPAELTGLVSTAHLVAGAARV